MTPHPLLVLHTSESTDLNATVRWMINKRIASHRAYDPAENRGIQIVDWDQPARSLRNEAGGVETNNRPGVYQIEIIGYAERVPTYGDQWFDNLAAEVLAICSELGIPIAFPARFLPYNPDGRPSSYGRDNGVRMTAGEWLTATGIVGHMHVPENTHGDPGDMTRLIERLSDAPPPRIQEDDAAIRWIQARLGVEADGVWGPVSRRAFEDLEALAASVDDLEAQIVQLQADLDQAEGRIDLAVDQWRRETLDQWEAFWDRLKADRS